MHDRSKDVAVLRRDLLSITGNYKDAIVLNQLLYWTKRVKDFGKWMKEENDIKSKEETESIALIYGWIYKSAEELSDEVMISPSKMTVGRTLLRLIDQGFISRRRNPKHKFDKIMQYRVNINIINSRLNKNGYDSVTFFSNDNEQYESFDYGDDSIENKKMKKKKETKSHGDTSDIKDDATKYHNDINQYQNDTGQYQNDTAIPEITSENTIENTLEKKEKYKKEKIWKETYEKFQEREDIYERIEKPKLAEGETLSHIDKMAYIIYKHYPRQEQRTTAMKSIARLLSRHICTFDDLLRHTIAYSYCRGKALDELRFTPLPSTWYNQHRFDDDDKKRWISKSPLIPSFDGLPTDHDIKLAYESAEMLMYDLYYPRIEKNPIVETCDDKVPPEEIDELQRLTEELFSPERNNV